MTVLVTGASGFVGQYLVDALLADGNVVLAITKNKIQDKNVINIVGDLQEISPIIEKLQGYNIDACIHLAWVGIPDYSFYNSVDSLQFGINMLKLCTALNIKTFISTGTCWEYFNPLNKINETDTLDNTKYYPIVKQSFQNLCEVYCKDNGMNFYWLRLFYVYGIGQRKTSIIPYVIEELTNNRQPILNGAYNANDFIYVTDVATAIIKVLKICPSQKIFNIGSGYATTVLDIVKIIADKMNFQLDLTQYSISNNPTKFWADIDLAKNEFGFAPKINITDGIDKMLGIK